MPRLAPLLAALVAAAPSGCNPLPMLRDLSPGVRASQDPDADAVWVEREAIVRFTEGATPTLEIDHCSALKVLTEAGARSYARAQIPYDRTDTSIEGVQARTILPDGQSVWAMPVDISDHPLLAADVHYSSARLRHVEFPEVEVGAILQLCYREVRSDPHASIELPLQLGAPVLLSRVILRAPDRLRFKALLREGGAVRPLALRYESREEESIALFEQRGLAALPDLPFAPPAEALATRFVLQPLELRTGSKVFRFRSDWDAVAKHFSSLAETQLAATPELSSLVARLTAGAGPEARARALYRYVQSQIRYVAIEYGKGRLQPSRAAETLARGYGDCKDKALLLSVMLRIAGIKSRLVLLGTRNARAASLGVPGYGSVNHAILALELGGARVLVDPTSSTTPFGELPPGDCDVEALLVEGERGIVIRTPRCEAERNRIELTTTLTLDEGGLARGQIRALVHGQPASRLRAVLIAEPARRHAEQVRAARHSSSRGRRSARSTTSRRRCGSPRRRRSAWRAGTGRRRCSISPRSPRASSRRRRRAGARPTRSRTVRRSASDSSSGCPRERASGRSQRRARAGAAPARTGLLSPWTPQDAWWWSSARSALGSRHRQPSCPPSSSARRSRSAAGSSPSSLSRRQRHERAPHDPPTCNDRARARALRLRGSLDLLTLVAPRRARPRHGPRLPRR